jgi:hypothetical protein
MDLKELVYELEVDETGSELCPVAVFGISGVGRFGFCYRNII